MHIKINHPSYLVSHISDEQQAHLQTSGSLSSKDLLVCPAPPPTQTPAQ